MPRSLYRHRYFKCLVCACIGFILWTIIGYLFSFDDEDFPEDVVYDIFIDETRDDHKHIPLHEEMLEELKNLENREKENTLKDPSDPIIMWWTAFTGEPGRARSCGDKSCFFTNDRKYRKHKNMKAFIFYGTDFNPNDLPLPRYSEHEWALFHEESPKNNYILCHEPVLTLFNHTSTFRRESDFPISTQHLLSLDWLLQSTYMKNIREKNSYKKEDSISPIVYVQSDCDPPSDRDEFVKLLMTFVPVDSYGGCINNKKLPQTIASPLEGMAHKDFFELISRYKFALAMENAVCEDYITEKMWRPLMVGTVPLIFGSPRAKDFLPSNDSALMISDFKSAEHVASFIKYLDRNDTAYEQFRAWKSSGIFNSYLRNTMLSRTWDPDDEEYWIPGHTNFIEGFECFVCERVHENIERKHRALEPLRRWGNIRHYGCPKPSKFDNKGHYGKETSWLDFWGSQWDRQQGVAKALLDCVLHNHSYCGDASSDERRKKDF